jgi:hypothetical protein
LTPDSDSQTAFAEQPGQGLVLPPWEERQRYGLLNAIYLTMRRSLLSPAAFYARMPTRLGLLQPLLYGMVMGVIGSFFQWMWALTRVPVSILFAENIQNVLYGPLLAGLIFLFSPLLMLVNLFVAAGVAHVTLMLLGGNRFGFEATFRVIAYTSSAAVILVLPFCGPLVILFWAPAAAAIGLQKIHGTEAWRAIMAILLPLLFGLLGCGGLSILTMLSPRLLNP